MILYLVASHRNYIRGIKAPLPHGRAVAAFPIPILIILSHIYRSCVFQEYHSRSETGIGVLYDRMADLYQTSRSCWWRGATRSATCAMCVPARLASVESSPAISSVDTTVHVGLASPGAVR